MFSVNEKVPTLNSKQIQGVQTLIIGRLVVIFLMFIATWIWNTGSFILTIDSFPQGPLLIFVISIGLTIIYFLLLRLSKTFRWQIRVQFLLDAFLITWLIWHTGDLSSPYILFYFVLITISSLYLKPVATILVTLICVSLFGALSLLTTFSYIQSSGIEQPTSKIIQIVSFHIVTFLAVGLLASRLSARGMAGEKLKETAKSLADLRALHERIIESIRSGLITTDLDGTIYTFNAAATEITGYRAEEMQGSRIFSLFGDIRRPIEMSLESVSEAEQPLRFEADLTTPDGFAVRIGYNITELFSEENEATGLIITFQDLTQIRSMEESTRRKDRLAAVGRVGAGLAHEIRNPLGAMRGAIQVLESNTPPESMHADLMGIILRESDRLNSIITNFLSYARPKVGNFTEIDASEAIRDIFTLLRHSPDVKEHHILEDILPPNPVFLSADETQLKQVLWNLARNAVQAMPAGGKLTIRLETILNSRIRITFEDTGKGMSPDAVERLFEPFASSTSGGTGLGLSIVYQIIRDHNGMINVRSTEGEGTVITVELPQKQNSQSPASESDSLDISEASNRLKTLLKVKNANSKISS